MIWWLIEKISKGRVRRGYSQWASTGHSRRASLPQERAARIGTGTPRMEMYGAILWAIECASRHDAPVGSVSQACDRVALEHRQGVTEWRKGANGPEPIYPSGFER